MPPQTPSVEQSEAKFKTVTLEEFIVQRDKSSKRPFLTPYTAEDMKDWQHFLTDDGVGFALTPDKDIVGVINNSGRKGVGQEAVTLAIAEGGKTLDCVEGYLDRYHNSFGFVEKSRIPWDESKAPEGWDYEKYDKRDIVFFEFPEGFSRDPADTARRLELARAEGGPLRTGELWDLDRWNAELAKVQGQRVDNQTPGGPGGGTEGGSRSSLESTSQESQPKPSEKQSNDQGQSEDKIVQFRNVGPDTTQAVQEVANNLLELARPTGLKRFWQNAQDVVSIDPAPKMARVGNFLADKAVEHASARIAAPKMVDNLLSSVFPDAYRNPEEMARTMDILVQDNILAGCRAKPPSLRCCSDRLQARRIGGKLTL